MEGTIYWTPFYMEIWSKVGTGSINVPFRVRRTLTNHTVAGNLTWREWTNWNCVKRTASCNLTWHHFSGSLQWYRKKILEARLAKLKKVAWQYCGFRIHIEIFHTATSLGLTQYLQMHREKGNGDFYFMRHIYLSMANFVRIDWSTYHSAL